MPASSNLFIFRSGPSPELSCFSASSDGSGLPQKLSPWTAVGVLRPDQVPPHGLSRVDIEAGVRSNGYQLWRSRKKAPAPTQSQAS